CCCDNGGSRILGFTGLLSGGMEFVGLFAKIGPEYWGCCCDNGGSRILGFTGLLGGVNGVYRIVCQNRLLILGMLL
ncbi:MAG: hypothetical protein AAFV78_07290, partial [Bacteroidota bacterium]